MIWLHDMLACMKCDSKDKSVNKKVFSEDSLNSKLQQLEN